MSRKLNIKELIGRDPEAAQRQSPHSGKETIKYGWTLFIICLVSTGLLSLVYSFTEERILNQKKMEESQSLKEVLSAASGIKEVKIGDLIYYEGLDKDNKKVGIAFIAEAKGYGGPVVICVGLDNQGKILAVKILSHSETPGLGSKVAEPEFLSRFINRPVKDIGISDAITGATISSTAVINGIRDKAFELIEKAGTK